MTFRSRSQVKKLPKEFVEGLLFQNGRMTIYGSWIAVRYSSEITLYRLGPLMILRSRSQTSRFVFIMDKFKLRQATLSTSKMLVKTDGK